MSENLNNRINNNLMRDIFVLEDEKNPNTSPVSTIWPRTIIDQVFDNIHPNQKTLREIIADLRQEIQSGGIGNIVFPVTYVNGKTGGEVWITATDIGLGRVDNTRDIDKPLSTPQRTAVMDILNTYNFNIDMQPFLNHMHNYNNPHNITLDDLDKSDGGSTQGALTTLIDTRISLHNTATHSNIHFDIRRSLSTLWNRVDDMDQNIESRIGGIITGLGEHEDDHSAHSELFQHKEDIINKVLDFSDTENNNHLLYPSTRSVINYVTKTISDFDASIPKINEWITDISVVNAVSDLPPAAENVYQQLFLLRKAPDNDGIQMGIAMCRKDSSDVYYWDISMLGAVSSFDNKYFLNRPGGLTLDMKAIIKSILEEEEAGDSGVITGDLLDNYLTKFEASEIYVRSVHIVPGDTDGCIRYYINNDLTTMSHNVKVSGLQTLAYKNYVTEMEIREEAVHNRHMLSRSVDSRVLAEGSVKREHLDQDLFRADKGSVLGNIFNDDGTVESIDMLQLSDILRPMIGGYDESIIPQLYPHKWDVDTLIPFNDGSYGMRFTGTISLLPNVQREILLTNTITSRDYQIMDTGGYLRIDSELEIDSPLGGTNLTGHTFSHITFDKVGIKLGTMSIGDRMDAPYDVWVRFVPRNIT